MYFSPVCQYISRVYVEPKVYKRIGCDGKATIRVMFQHRNHKRIGGAPLDTIMRIIERYVGACFVPESRDLCYQKRILRWQRPPLKPTCCEDTAECVQCFAKTCLSCFKRDHSYEFDLYSPGCCCCLHVPIIAVLVIGCILA